MPVDKAKETLWQVAIEMTYKILELSNDNELYNSYRSRMTAAYWNDEDKRDKNLQLIFREIGYPEK